MSQVPRNLLDYRHFIGGSVAREFHARYQNSVLGALWAVINPFAMIVVYTVIFSQVMKNRLAGADSTFAYSIHLCAGLLAWNLFAEIVSKCQTVFVDNANLMKKLSFPQLCLPLVSVINALINFLIIFGLFTLFLLLTGNFPGWVYFLMFPLLLVQIIFASGLGLVLGVLNVFFRDVGQFVGIALQFWFWMTPVVYQVAVLPQALQRFVLLNPMADFVMAYQDILLGQRLPDGIPILAMTVLALLVFAWGLHVFGKHAADMVDEL